MAYVLYQPVQRAIVEMWCNPTFAAEQITAGSYNNDRSQNVSDVFYDSTEAPKGHNMVFDLEENAVVFFAASKEKLKRGLLAHADVEIGCRSNIVIYRNNYGLKVLNMLRTLVGGTVSVPFHKAKTSWKYLQQAGGLFRSRYNEIENDGEVQRVRSEPIQYPSWSTVGTAYKRKTMISSGYYILLCSAKDLPRLKDNRRSYVPCNYRTTLGAIASDLATFK